VDCDEHFCILGFQRIGVGNLRFAIMCILALLLVLIPILACNDGEVAITLNTGKNVCVTGCHNGTVVLNPDDTLTCIVCENGYSLQNSTCVKEQQVQFYDFTKYYKTVRNWLPKDDVVAAAVVILGGVIIWYLFIRRGR